MVPDDVGLGEFVGGFVLEGEDEVGVTVGDGFVVGGLLDEYHAYPAPIATIITTMIANKVRVFEFMSFLLLLLKPKQYPFFDS